MTDKIRWIASVWRPLHTWFIALVVLTVASTAVAVAYPLVLRQVIDALHGPTGNSIGGPAGDVDAVVQRSVLLLGIVGIVSYLASFYPPLRAYLNTRIESAVRERYFGHVLTKGERFFRRFRTGDLVTRLTDDIQEYPKIAWFCCSGIFRAVESSTKLAFCLLVMFALDWKLTLLAIMPLPLMCILFVILHRSLGRRVLAQRQEASKTTSLLQSSFSGIPIVKAFTAEHRRADHVNRQLTSRIDVEMDLVKLWQLHDELYRTLNVIGQIVVVAAGGIMVLRGELTVGTFYAFYTYLGMLVVPLFDLPNLLVTGKQTFVCIDRLEELRTSDAASELGTRSGDERIDTVGELTFERVGFGYDDATDVLAEVDLTVRRGERVAIVGRLATGKSTLLRLAAGELSPKSGRVLIDGRPLTTLDRASFGRRVGAVGQEPVLFSESVRENVVFGRSASDDDADEDQRLGSVLDAVGMSDEVAGFTDGVDQMVGQRGATLSGGQRQRLAMARALYGRPSLLLLDDLTSALDADNEHRLWRAVDALLGDVTMMVVTHRVATARAMDRIYVLDGGRIAASGGHDELVRDSRLYRELVQEQT